MKSNIAVSAWEESVIIPTYGIGKPEKNPIFLEKRVYQGSSGVVYPHPVIEKILDDKKNKSYPALFLENQYLKIMIFQSLVAAFKWLMIKSRNVILFIITR